MRTREPAKNLLTLRTTPASVPLAGKVKRMGERVVLAVLALSLLAIALPHPWALHLSGERCTVDIDECLSKPCKNHAQCHNIQGSYLCECRPGFTGGDCDSNIDDCLSSEYQHIAQCFPVFTNNKFAGCCLTDAEQSLMISCQKGKKKPTPSFSFVMFEAVKIHRVWLLEMDHGVLTDCSCCSQILSLRRSLEFTYFNKKHC